MRKLRKCTTSFLMALIVSAAAAPQIMAASMPMAANMTIDANAAMAQLRMEDQGPDSSKGILVSEVWGTEEDGTPYVERTYEDVSSRVAGTKKYTKTKSYGATGSVEVTGWFRYDSVAKTVYVDSCEGQYNSGGGISDFEDKGAVPLNEGTSKASAKYSCRVNRNLGGWATYSVTVSCNSSGNKS